MELLFIWPMFAIAYCGVAGIVIWLAWQRGKLARWILVLLFFPGFLVWDLAPGWSYFNDVCLKKAGLTTSPALPVIDVLVVDEGHDLVGGCEIVCAELLGLYGIRAVELEVQKPNFGLYYARNPGLHRFTLAPLDSTRCDAFKSARLAAGRSKVDERSLPPETCIYGERISQFSSQYVYHSDQREEDIHPVFFMVRRANFISRRDTGEVLGSVTQYGFGGGWVSTNLGFGRRFPDRCPNDDEYNLLSRKLITRFVRVQGT